MTTRKRILVADDEPVLRQMLKTMLEEAGFDVILAEDGRSVVEKVTTDKPDLVLMDGLLPKLHGFRACKAIKELHQPPRVVLFTGIYTKPSYHREAVEQYGADDMLGKPVDLHQLLQCIDKQLNSGRSPE